MEEERQASALRIQRCRASLGAAAAAVPWGPGAGAETRTAPPRFPPAQTPSVLRANAGQRLGPVPWPSPLRLERGWKGGSHTSTSHGVLRGILRKVCLSSRLV